VFGIAVLRFDEKSLDVSNPDGPIEFEALAVELAGVCADVTEDSRERELFADGLERFSEPARPGQLDIEVGVHSEGAARFTIGGALAPAPSEDPVGDLLDAPMHSSRRAKVERSFDRSATPGFVTGA
jgi:hypothetical protein